MKPKLHTRNLLFVCLLSFAGAAVPALADVPATSVTVPGPAPLEPLPWWRTVIEQPLDLLWFAFDPQPELAPLAPAQPEVPGCMVAPLAPVDDSEAAAFENGQTLDTGNLTLATGRALNRFETVVQRAGGTFTLRSAYRPPAYQQHLIDVWDKWMVDMRDNTDPACSQLRTDVWTEFQRHNLLESQRPAVSSDHMRGLAFDAAVFLPSRARLGRRRATLDLLARAVGLHRPVPQQDWVHYRLLR